MPIRLNGRSIRLIPLKMKSPLRQLIWVITIQAALSAPMSIEINELMVNATLEEAGAGDHPQAIDRLYSDLVEIKAQIISECKDLINELLDKQGDR